MQQISDIVFKLESDFNLLKNFGIWGALLGLLFAVVYCFFGFKLVKVFVTLFGILFGSVIGAGLARLLNFKESWYLVSIVLGMIIFGVIAFFVFKLGLAFMVGISSFSILISITGRFLQGNAVWVVAVIAAILIGVITSWAPRPIVIVTSAFAGGVAASGILFHQVLPQYFWAQMGYVQNIVVFIVGIILAIFGMIIQFQRK